MDVEYPSHSVIRHAFMQQSFGPTDVSDVSFDRRCLYVQCMRVQQTCEHHLSVELSLLLFKCFLHLKHLSALFKKPGSW